MSAAALLAVVVLLALLVGVVLTRAAGRHAGTPWEAGPGPDGRDSDPDPDGGAEG